MLHTILYHGWYEQSIAGLQAGRRDYARKKDGSKTTGDVPSKKAEGIFFGYMQDADGFVAVKAGTVILDKPVRLIPKHTDGKGFGPQPSLFGDISAQTLLKDMMKKNPKQKDALQALYDRTFAK